MSKLFLLFTMTVTVFRLRLFPLFAQGISFWNEIESESEDKRRTADEQSLLSPRH